PSEYAEPARGGSRCLRRSSEPVEAVARHATRPTVPTHAPGPSAPPPCRREPFEIARGRSGTGRDPPGPAAGAPRPARCRDHVRKRFRACENLIAQRTAGRDGAVRATARAGRRGSPGPEGG